MVKKCFPLTEATRQQNRRGCNSAALAAESARRGCFREKSKNHVAMAPQRGHPPFIKIIAIKDGTRLGADDTSRVGFRARPVALF
jgi:hypothetical protein